MSDYRIIEQFMGIRVCPECGGKVSDSRLDCPHCGYVFTMKCPDCGREVSADCRECPDCGHVFFVEEQQLADAKVIVCRERSFLLSSMTFTVNVDGVNMANLKNGENCSFSVAPGKHSITIESSSALGWINAVARIDVEPNDEITINCVGRCSITCVYSIEITSITKK